MLDTSAFIEGLLLGAGLFTSVGPKDAFVIKRSISSPHLLSIAVVCAGSDALLIMLGVQGLSSLLSRHPGVVLAALWAGIAYLAGYGLLALRSAIRRRQPEHVDGPRTGSEPTRARTVLATAAVSLLNPYAWIDTVLLLGTVIVSHTPAARAPFAIGAMTASFAWFLMLAYGARACRAWFARTLAWRVLDCFVAVMMLGFAVRFAIDALQASAAR
ncbi:MULTISPECIES: LysE/ArgO family amino acid transporter [Burkholderia]|uniref:LysE family transporter n=2 Tax=Burkholderia contaminans TaxID=488447 RepID=A0A1E3FYS9_9BURK|nr:MULTISPECIES: LysE family transporter [Burkholderia]UTP21384.1 LysE family transporter [Burkholderia sp. FXe9]KKL39904.1 lysine transporter LysE [Burkholderia contaminans LMG 23361]MBA9828164.1 lysine transporter LysE [Burkholderia contaminans]MBA9836713.1 lysine transporter LysE [Burkholderia contaminans]MBA9865082.1 lysine transporter LysE [Burkholderia contaminans]